MPAGLYQMPNALSLNPSAAVPIAASWAVGVTFRKLKPVVPTLGPMSPTSARLSRICTIVQ